MLDADNAVLVLDPPDPDDVYANYLRTCAMLNVEPVSRERAREPVREWAAAFAVPCR